VEMWIKKYGAWSRGRLLARAALVHDLMITLLTHTTGNRAEVRTFRQAECRHDLGFVWDAV